MTNSFEQAWAEVQRQGIAMSRTRAYEEEIAPALLNSEPTATEEREFLGPLPQEEDLEDCVQVDLGDCLGTAEDNAPAPLDDEFAFHKPVHICGELNLVYEAFRGFLVEGAEVGSIQLPDRKLEVHPHGDGYCARDEQRGLLYTSEPTHKYEWGDEYSILIWVSQTQDNEILGYIRDIWVYTRRGDGTEG